MASIQIFPSGWLSLCRGHFPISPPACFRSLPSIVHTQICPSHLILPTLASVYASLLGYIMTGKDKFLWCVLACVAVACQRCSRRNDGGCNGCTKKSDGCIHCILSSTSVCLSVLRWGLLPVLIACFGSLTHFLLLFT